MNQQETIDFLYELNGIGEVYAVYTFQCTRQSKTGAIELVEIEIKDAGDSGDLPRYMVSARNESKSTSGNSSDDLHVAIAGVHWWELDEGFPAT